MTTQTQVRSTVEALKLALEALEEAWYHVGTFQPTEKAIDLYEDARAAIKEALAQPEQEPVANASTWFALVMNAAAELENASQCLRDEDAKRVAIRGAKYYRDQANTLYTHPQPKREWVRLTDEEVEMLVENKCADPSEQIRFVEAKLKAKNERKEKNTRNGGCL